jgi:hypothetical protein
MTIFLGVLIMAVIAFGLLGPWTAGMAYNWNGWTVVWLTVFDVLAMAAVAGWAFDHHLLR